MIYAQSILLGACFAVGVTLVLGLVIAIFNMLDR